jgi:hypothetical protein
MQNEKDFAPCKHRDYFEGQTSVNCKVLGEGKPDSQRVEIEGNWAENYRVWNRVIVV